MKRVFRILSISVLDLVFYIILIIAPLLSLWMLTSHVLNSPLNFSYTGSYEQLRDQLFTTLFVVLSAIFLYLGLMLINFSLIKNLIWHITLKKKVKIMWKSMALVVLLGAIFLVPLIVGMFPFIQIGNVQYTLINYIPILIVFFFAVYCFSMSNYFLVKTGSLFKAIKQTFRTENFIKVAIGFVVLFAALFLFWWLFSYIAFMRLIMLPITLIISSYFLRQYIAKKV